MADQDLALKTMAQRGVGDPVKRDRVDIVGLVGVKIEIEPEIDGFCKQAIEQCIQIGNHVGDRAENAQVAGDGIGELI